MKKLTFLTILAVLIHVNVSSQPCPSGMNITCQADIDNFQYNYPNCTEIQGTVYITGDDIKNLDSLNVLTTIWGRLVIYGNDSLTSISGLSNLDSIGGDLGIFSNPMLYKLIRT